MDETLTHKPVILINTGLQPGGGDPSLVWGFSPEFALEEQNLRYVSNTIRIRVFTGDIILRFRAIARFIFMI
jgi:hypothetical protein